MVMLNSDKLQREFIDKKGVHVIVGQYVEKNLKFDDDYNLTSDILNTNNYSPIPGAGKLVAKLLSALNLMCHCKFLLIYRRKRTTSLYGRIREEQGQIAFLHK